jgi:hypothetical protein
MYNDILKALKVYAIKRNIKSHKYSLIAKKKKNNIINSVYWVLKDYNKKIKVNK